MPEALEATRSCTKARNGAIPVPGPIMMMSFVPSSGSLDKQTKKRKTSFFS